MILHFPGWNPSAYRHAITNISGSPRGDILDGHDRNTSDHYLWDKWDIKHLLVHDIFHQQWCRNILIYFIISIWFLIFWNDFRSIMGLFCGYFREEDFFFLFIQVGECLSRQILICTIEWNRHGRKLHFMVDWDLGILQKWPHTNLVVNLQSILWFYTHSNPWNVRGHVVGAACVDTVRPTRSRQVTKNLSCVHFSVKRDEQGMFKYFFVRFWN